VCVSTIDWWHRSIKSLDFFCLIIDVSHKISHRKKGFFFDNQVTSIVSGPEMLFLDFPAALFAVPTHLFASTILFICSIN